MNFPGVQSKPVSERDVHRFERRFMKLLDYLQNYRIEGFVLAHPDDLFVAGGDMVYATMQHMRDEGIAAKIGISVFSGEEIDRYLYHYDFDIVQLPLNVFDQRLLRSAAPGEAEITGYSRARPVPLFGGFTAERGRRSGAFAGGGAAFPGKIRRLS